MLVYPAAATRHIWFDILYAYGDLSSEHFHHKYGVALRATAATSDADCKDSSPKMYSGEERRKGESQMVKFTTGNAARKRLTVTPNYDQLEVCRSSRILRLKS